MTLAERDHVVVVGAGLAGWRVVQGLRHEGFTGAITLVGEEDRPPYDRPPLSKQVLSGKWTLERATLATEEQLAALTVDLRLGVRATSLDVATTTVTLADGREVVGTHVVLALGARARTLTYPSSGPLASLRNAEDLITIERQLRAVGASGTVVIIGGGFVGAEAATSLHARGLTPIVLEAASRPLVSVLGDEVSAWLERLPSEAGVELRVDQRVLDVVPVNGRYDVVLEGGHLEADVVLAAVGSTLDLGWLDGSGLTLDDGVVVDRDLAAATHVAALGDVARFPLAGVDGDELVRVEHWQVATDHAAHLAKWWVAGERPAAAMVPYFWSDQYGKKLQLLGHPHRDDDVRLVAGDVESAKWLALYARGGVVTGVVALSQPRGLMLAKTLLDERATLASALERHPWTS